QQPRQSRRRVELEQANGIEAENPRPLFVGQTSHGALDRLGGVWPGTLVVGIVIRPQDIVNKVILDRQIESHLVLLKGSEAVQAEVFTGEQLQLREGPHVVLLVGFVHRLQCPRQPANTGLSPYERKLEKPSEDP